jgi:hypothetical protein
MSPLIALSLATSMSLAQHPIRDTSGSVHVHIETDSPEVELFRNSGMGKADGLTTRGSAAVGVTHFEPECRAPCDRSILEPSADFIVSGQGITSSRAFSLLGHGEDVHLYVRPGSAVLRGLSGYAIIFGVTAALLGGSMLVVDRVSSTPEPSAASGRGLAIPGWLTLLGGGALVGAGIPLFVFSSTHVEFFPETAR